MKTDFFNRIVVIGYALSTTAQFLRLSRAFDSNSILH